MFRSALFKLTAVYVFIVMAISILFSVILYNLAVQELQTGFENQYVRWLTEYRPYGLRQPGDPAAELAERANHIYAQLVYLNVLVFGVTSVASYWLARRTLRPIERAHEQQKRFTADVSHELRTPLTALKMDTEVALLDKKASVKKLRQTLESSLEESVRMENLINNLLQLATLEANKLRTEFSRVNLKDSTASAVQVVQKYADSKNIRFVMTLKDADVIGNKANLIQLVIIMLENAVKYSPHGSEVQIVTSRSAKTATIMIEDSGMGIPSESLPHIFDRFYRADEARGSDAQTRGFGLGLSLAKLIADVHNGEIILTSTPGKGTRAVVRLPIAPKIKT